MDFLYDKINKLYEKAGFLETYGGSLVMTIIIFLVFFILISYYYIKSKMKNIQQNWAEEKCNPSVIPFAGLINPPPDGSAMDYTGENFNQCLNNTLEGVADIAMEPIQYSVSIVNSFMDGVMDAVNSLRDLLSRIRDSIGEFSKNVMARVLSIIMPLLYVLIKMKDSFQKVNGVMGTAIFSLLGAYDTLRSLMNSIAEFIVLILIIIAVVIYIGIGLSYNIFTFPIGITMIVVNTIIFLLILIPFVLIEVYMGDLLQLNFPSPPSLPKCFSGNTLVIKEDGSLCMFKDLKIGDKLIHDGEILSFMKLSAHGETMYNYGNICVSGKHKIYVDKNTLTCIEVCKDKRFEKIDNNEEFLYCIETENNTITIDNIVFTDYNDIDEQDNNILDCIYNEENSIHNKFSGGFHKNTVVEMMDGQSVFIKDVEVNSTLRYGERVLGVVKIKADDLDIMDCNHDFMKIKGRNIHFIDKNLGVMCSQKMEGVKTQKTKYLYHLITNKQRFHINGTMILDYNSCVDCYLDKEKILSAVLI
jgi:hypothetical protein